MKQWKKVLALGLCACMLGSVTITSVKVGAETTVADTNMTSITLEDGTIINYDSTLFSVDSDGIASSTWYTFQTAEIVYPNGITGISNKATDEYESVLSVVIPDSVVYIKENSFPKSCFINLKEIKGYTGSYAEAYAKENGFTFTSLGVSRNPYVESDFIVLKGKLMAYTGTESDIILPNTVKTICSNVFKGSVRNVVLPSSVTTIERDAFYMITGLTIIIPPTVVTIDTKAFGVMVPDALTIKGVSGSYAETYAKEKNYTFVEATEEELNPPTPTPTPTPSETTKPTETPIPSESEQPTPSETVQPSETPITSETPIPSETVKPSETPDISGGAVQTDPNIDPITGKEYGDADMDGDISLKDAQMTLRVALRIDDASEDTIRLMSGGGNDVDLKHAQKILRLALRIDDTYHEVNKKPTPTG